MNEIVDYLISKDKLPVIILGVFAIVYAYAATLLLKKIKQRRLLRKDVFIETFLKGISEDTIQNTEDLLNVYSGITSQSIDDLSNKQGLNKWLREILAKLINREVGKDLDHYKLLSIKTKITEFIKANERISPFADLPETERNILNDIAAYNKSKDSDSIARKINELSSVIITRHEQQKKIENLNRWSIPLAVIGLILTVIFGILSII